MDDRGEKSEGTNGRASLKTIVPSDKSAGLKCSFCNFGAIFTPFDALGAQPKFSVKYLDKIWPQLIDNPWKILKMVL